MDNKQAIEFLKRWHPSRWVLTAIDPTRKGITTKTLETEEGLKEFLQQYNGNRNIYFHVNPVMSLLNKKAQRQDIKTVDYLHVDIDPRVGFDIEAEQQRSLKMLQDPPKGVPKPTCIVFSGGGYQGFWKLKEPIEIEGDLVKAEEAKLFNIQLETIFGADNCHNIDRVMRLPGTLNIPDAKKKKKGRTTTLATLVEFNDTEYSLSEFTAATQTNSYNEAGFSGRTVELTGNIERYESVDDIPVDDKTRVLIAQGVDPDEEGKYPSRSEALFAVCCALVRAGLTDDQIYSIITDPEFEISSSVLEKKNKAEPYAARQIERAREDAVDPALREMNEKHAVIGDIGGKCLVISEVFDPALQRTKISRQTFEALRNRYMNRKIKVGESKDGNNIYHPLGKWWLENPLRRQFETVVFAPGRVVPNSYNLWKGFACEAVPGDCELFLKHMKEVICEDNEEYFNYLFGWMASAVQKPDSPGQVAVVMRGRMGTGKSFFAKEFGFLFGRHFMQVSDPKHLVGSFNSHLRDCVVLFGDEAFYAGDKRHESVLKTLITEEYITIEAKGVDAEAALNYVHLMMASNNNWVVPAGGDERRYFVVDVNDTKMQDTKYFHKLAELMKNGGREALLFELLNYDLTNFNVRKVPKTKALQEQKLLSMSPDQEWWYSKLQEGILLPGQNHWEQEVQKNDLLEDYLEYMRKIGIMRRSNATTLGKFLMHVCPEGYPASVQKWVESPEYDRSGFERLKKHRPYFYSFPTLENCRNYFRDCFGYDLEWQKVVYEEEPEYVTPF
jgi:hypothetical protein